MSAKKSFFILSILSLIILITSICAPAEAKSVYKDIGVSAVANNSTAVNNELIPNQRPADILRSTRSSLPLAPDADYGVTISNADLQEYSALIYDGGGRWRSIEEIQDVLYSLNISYYLRGPGNPVTAQDLDDNDVLIVATNWDGNMTGLDPNILADGITGSILLTGHDPDFHIDTVGCVPCWTFLSQAISFVIATPGTGLVALSDNFTTAFSYSPERWGISAIGGLAEDTITSFTTVGLASGVFDNLTPADMSNWGNSYHAKFTAWGYDFAPFELGGDGSDVVTISNGCITLTNVDDVDDGDCRGLGGEIEITYTISYSYLNDANLPDIEDVNIIDYLPGDVEFISASSDGSYNSNAHTVRWQIGTVSPGNANSVTLTVKVKERLLAYDLIKNLCEIKTGDLILKKAYEYTPVCSVTALMPTDDLGAPHLRIIDIATGVVSHTINFAGTEGLTADVDVVVTPDGATALMPTDDLGAPHLRIIDIATGVVSHTINFAGTEGLTAGVDVVVVTPDSTTALMPTDDLGAPHLRIIDIATGTVTYKIDFGPTENLTDDVDVVVTPNGATALMPTNDLGGSHLRIIDIATGVVSHTINFAGTEGLTAGVDVVVVTPDSTTALMPTDDLGAPHLRIIDIATGTVTYKIDFGPTENLTDGVDVVLTIDPNTVLMPTDDLGAPHLRIIDIATGTVTYKIDFGPTENLIAGVDAVACLGASGCPVSLDEDFPLDDDDGGHGDIPTLSEWGLIIMGLLLLTGGTIVIRKRFRAVPT